MIRSFRMGMVVAVVALVSVTSAFLSPVAGASPASAVNLTYIYNDLSILATEHLAPSDGNILGDVTDIVAYLNANGGLGGHQIHLTTYKMPSLTGSAATDHAACLAATEQDHAAIVLIGNAVGDDVGQCITGQHGTVALASDGPAVSIFQQAHGRLFSSGSDESMDAQRLTEAMASVTSHDGYLTNKKIGVIVQGIPENQAEVSGTLVPTLKRLGHKVVATATVPYPTDATNCSEVDPAIQVMKQAGANVVFLAAYDLCAVSVVSAAKSDDYSPQWITDADNTTATVSSFFAPVKDEWNGALGVTDTFPSSSGVPASAAQCVQKALVPKGLDYAVGSDAYGIATLNCIQLQDIATAIKNAGASPSEKSLVSALEAEKAQPSNAGPSGSWGPDQHDSGNWVFLAKYSAAAGKMLPVGGKPVAVRIACPCAP